MIERRRFLWLISITILSGLLSIAYLYYLRGQNSSNMKGLDAIYTVQHIEKMCVDGNSKCKWKVVYVDKNLTKSVLVDEPKFLVGERVYERLICKRVGGKDDGKIYDPRSENVGNNCTHSILPKFAFSTIKDIGKSCGGWCEMEFQGHYQEN